VVDVGTRRMTHPLDEPGCGDYGMGMAYRLRVAIGARWQIARQFSGPARLAASAVLGALGILGLWRSEGPPDLQPPILSAVAGVLPWWAWLVLALLVLLVSVFEGAFRQIVASREMQSVASLQRFRQQASDEAMKNWVRNAARDPTLGLRGLAFFGSVTRDYDTRDVDVLMILPDSKREAARTAGDKLRELSHGFRCTFSRELHYQLFFDSERARIVEFIQRAGGVQWVFGEKEFGTGTPS
jgi:hypothetical protein